MSSFDITSIVAQLRQVRDHWREQQNRTESGHREFPSRDAIAQAMEALKGVLYPQRLGPSDLRHASEDFYVAHTLDNALQILQSQAQIELHYRHRSAGATTPDPSAFAPQALRAVQTFAQQLPHLRQLLDIDVLAAFHGDPAARSADEVVLSYPGVLALIHHRIAHAFYKLEQPLLGRIMAELAHGQTGIDIHPGAQIGAGFFIDHGTGVVIGETAVIGQNVRIYQAVTLGAKRFPKDAQGHLQKGWARHPIVEDDVVIYAGATILGRVTIGKGAVIGGNVWITDDVAPGTHVSQARLRQADLTAEHAVAPVTPSATPLECPSPASEQATHVDALTIPAQRFVQDFWLAVRQLREGGGWSQEQVAAMSDLNCSSVGEIERGQVAPSLITLHKLAHALQLAATNLLAHSEHVRQQRTSLCHNLKTRLAVIAD